MPALGRVQAAARSCQASQRTIEGRGNPRCVRGGRFLGELGYAGVERVRVYALPLPGHVKSQLACPMDGAAYDMGAAQSFDPRHALQ